MHDITQNRRNKAVLRLETQLKFGRTIWKKGVKELKPLTDKERDRIKKEIANIKTRIKDARKAA